MVSSELCSTSATCALLIPTLTAVENIEAKPAPTGIRNPDLRNRALAFLEEVGLAERAIHLPARTSGGEHDVGLAERAPRRISMRDGRAPYGGSGRCLTMRVCFTRGCCRVEYSPAPGSFLFP